MNLHPDVITDLVILYHAGEASQATRELLEKEALQNPAIAVALAARPRFMQPLEAEPMIREQEVLKRVRQHYLYRAVIAIGLVLAFIVMFSLLRSSKRPGLGSSHVSGGAPTENTKGTPDSKR